ncbi:MAG: hypothetical protein DA408_20390 [Bacteroidetes bacterium]|nr:MAG: hypothetical protein C7N36_14395 [Bacteroidota bacterium]PTM08527.1 MAG: hypothetical protein DA408_20390 [Bacteroidota bacterium]
MTAKIQKYLQDLDLSMARKMMENLSGQEAYKLKTFFYALRTAVLCKWIVEEDDIPPIEFHHAYQNLGIAAGLVKRIDELIAFKSTQSEVYRHTGEADLIAFIHACLAAAEEKKDKLPVGNCKAEQLNVLLRKYVHKYGNQ